MCSTHPQRRCCLRIFSFLFTMFKNRGGLTTKEAASPQAVFQGYPRIFVMSFLYTFEGLDVNFRNGTIFRLAA
jgi:hypothetical protein